MTEELNEIAQLLAGNPEPEAPDENRTEPTEPTDQEIDPLAAESDQPKESETEVDAPETEPQATTIKGLAEKLGTSPKKLYDSIELVPGFTLGMAKDRIADLQESDGMNASVEERRITATNEIEQQRHEANLTIALPDHTPEQRQEAWSLYSQQQNALAVSTIEGWSDPGTREAELPEIAALLQEYGVPAARINTMVGAQELRILADYNRLRKRVSKATETVVKPKPVKQFANSKHKRSQSAADKINSDLAAGKIGSNDAIRQLIANG
jgi:hypothetical protein